MVIAHVLSSFGLGGQERVAIDLARRQRAAGHDVLAVSLAPRPEGPSAASFRAAGARATTVAKGPRLDPSLPLRLAAHLASERVEVVHTHNPHALVYGAPASKLARAALVHTKHGINPDRLRRIWLRRAAARLVDAYVAVTPALATIALRNHECAPARLCVIPSGIDAFRFMPNAEARRQVRAELGIPEDAWVVGTVGRIAREKDQALLVEAAAPLLGERHRLVIVGDGPERAALAELVEGTGRGRYVSMTGTRSDAERLLAAFDVLALTSRTEGLPIALLEAMATELPVVATSVGGIPDVIEPGVTGFLVDVGDRERLTAALSALSTGPQLGRRVGQAARQSVSRRHSLERMARRYDELYQRVLRRLVPVGTAALEGAVGP